MNRLNFKQYIILANFPSLPTLFKLLGPLSSYLLLLVHTSKMPTIPRWAYGCFQQYIAICGPLLKFTLLLLWVLATPAQITHHPAINESITYNDGLFQDSRVRQYENVPLSKEKKNENVPSHMILLVVSRPC